MKKLWKQKKNFYIILWLVKDFAYSDFLFLK